MTGGDSLLMLALVLGKHNMKLKLYSLNTEVLMINLSMTYAQKHLNK